MKKFSKSVSRPAPFGFTIIELLLSTALIAVIMVLMLGTVDQTQRLWSRSTGKVSQFQTARAAFESMTRRLSQATLNTYYRAHDLDVTNNQAAFQFRRLSDLQFLSAPMLRVVNSSPSVQFLPSDAAHSFPTQSVFFFAPLGYTEEFGTTAAESKMRRFRGLDSLLAATGYYVEFGDEPNRPDFLKQMSPALPSKYRFRLYEMDLPSERLANYQRPTSVNTDRYVDPRVFDESGNYYGGSVDKTRLPITGWKRPLWMKEMLVREATTGGSTGHRFKYSRVMADNVVALIILPKLAERDRVLPGTSTVDAGRLDLAPRYEYDSWRILSGGTARDPLTSMNLDNTARDNLLPPIVQVSLVAIDEPSAVRLDATPSSVPSWTDGLFTKVENQTQFNGDMTKLEENLRGEHTAPRVNYRIFTTDVVIRGSKWSRDPQ